MDVSRYIDLPFVDRGRTWKGADCWGLIHLAFSEELNIELRDWSDIYWSVKDLDPVNIDKAAEIEKASWVRVSKPIMFDVVAFRVGTYVSHVGLVVESASSLMLHTRAGSEACVERYNNFYWKKRIEGFYRHVQRL